ncbi:hypothetical protein [Gordonia sp. VNK21]|uniref:hypothetical protein n=1 Tax=Gordonia sp. VNK21 TaxID=3382483 RepID=UPI0038D4C501
MNEFRISQDALAGIVAVWRQAGERLGALGYPPAPDPAGSAVMGALNDCAVSAAAISAALAGDVQSLAEALARFTALTVDADRAVAAEIAAGGLR